MGKSIFKTFKFSLSINWFFRVWMGLYILGFYGCKVNHPTPEQPMEPMVGENRVIILNEGNFMFGNGSISVIDKKTGSVTNDVYQSQNGVPLGDVPQSMIQYNGLGYIVVNNSGKIEVVDLKDFSSVKTISGFTSPRQMTIVNQNPLLAWVTDLYANKIWEIDLQAGIIQREIPLMGWSENIFYSNSEVFILNKSDSVIHVLDANTGALKTTLNVGGSIIDFKQWSSSELMVLSKKGLYKLDMDLVSFLPVYSFDSSRTALRMAVDTVQELVYFIDNDVFVFDPSSLQPKVEVFLSKSLVFSFYGLEVDSENNSVYVTNTKDFVQKGEVIALDVNGNELAKYLVGVNPQFLVFD